MKLFYSLAVCLILLSGLAAKAILQPLEPPGRASTTVITVKQTNEKAAKLSWVKSRMQSQCCGKCI
ncbi:MAG: hypothetical protein JNK20_05305 [Flavipsychrobacter sp.]|nr:hypothetical protein [Flavipsychrobacter sp.]